LSLSQSNSQTDFRSALTGKSANFGSSFFYNQPNKVILGSTYLFDEWNNDGEIQTVTGERFLVRNINLNLSRNAFEAKVNDNDSIFSFNFNNIKQIVINGKSYKNYYFNEENRVYELIYSNENFSILKKESYFIRDAEDKSIQKFKLNKRSFSKLFSNKDLDLERIERFSSSKRISFKDEEDVIQLLKFAFSN
jgi:hypothetical protein